MEPLVSIILVNYNGFEDTVECVKSIQKIIYSNYNVVVVDNCSTKEPTNEQLEFLKTNTHFISTEKNLGFSGGNNVGIHFAEVFNPDYVLLLNNDTVVKDDFLDILVNYANKMPDVGIVVGKIYHYDEPERIWYAGGWYDRENGIHGHYGWYKTDAEIKNTDYDREITFATGCMMLIPMIVLKNVGYLSEEYFLYAEDTDYSCHMIDNGYKLYYCKNSVIYHKVSRSTGKNSNNTQYYMARNELKLIQKYGTKKAKAYGLHVYYMIKHILRGRKKLKPNLKAYYDFVRRRDGRHET